MGVIIGTSGHVDHGKTELIKALTGVDTDRLEEEKRRGLTIDLGFAPFDLTQTGRVGIVDVPGHQRFLKNMLAGVGEIDIALLVVAADEGVMPQTREHFQILRLLRVPQMVVVISKMDLADEEMATLVEEEVRDLIRGTYLEESPFLRTSASTGEGLDELRRTVDLLASQFPPKDPNAPPRLPVDRVFVLRGVGTVITGSLVSGRLSQGEEVIIFPRGSASRIRQIQVHNQRQETAEAGHRVALDLVGVGKVDIQRGDVLSRRGSFTPTTTLDLKLEVLPGVPRVKDWTRIRLYLGTAEILGRLAILGRRSVGGGEEAYCQIRLEEPTVALFGDRFIVRDYSPMRLLGGGVILDALPPSHRRSDRRVVERLETRAGGDLRKIVVSEVASKPWPSDELRRSLNLSKDAFSAVVDELVAEEVVETLGHHLFHREHLESIRRQMVEDVEAFHRRNPLRVGMPREELRRKFSAPGELFEVVLSTCEGLELLGDKVSLTYRQVSLTPEQAAQKEQIEEAFLGARFAPPSKEDIVSRYDQGIFYSLVEQGNLVKIRGDYFLHRKTLEEAKRLLTDHLKREGELEMSQIRDLLQTTRKFAVPLAEFLDRSGFTRRVGDKRVLETKSGVEPQGR